MEEASPSLLTFASCCSRPPAAHIPSSPALCRDDLGVPSPHPPVWVSSVTPSSLCAPLASVTEASPFFRRFSL